MGRIATVVSLSSKSAMGLALMSCAFPVLGEEREDSLELESSLIEGAAEPRYRAEQSASVKLSAPLLEVPQTVTVVPNALIREQNALSLRRVLSNVSGITFNAGEGGGGSGDSLNIRGFNADANLQLDGLRDSAQTSRSDTFNLSTVEVIKGPNSVFGGAGTTGGSVNMISKTPQAEAFTHLGAGLGSAQYRRLTLDTNQPLQGWGEGTLARLNLMVHDSNVPGRDHIDKQRWGLAPSLLFGHGSDTRLTLSMVHQRDDNQPDYGLPARDGKVLAGVKRHAYFGWRNLDRERIDSSSLTVKVEHDLNAHWTLQNLSRYGQVKRDTVISASHVNTIGLPPGRYRPAGPQAYGRDVRTDLWINQASLTGEFDAFGLGHRLVAGMELSREHYRRDAYSYNIGGFFPKEGYDLSQPPGYWRGPTAKAAIGSTDNRLDNQALYLIDTVALNGKWDLSLGLRYDHIDARAADAKPLEQSKRAAARDAVLSSRAGLVFKPMENGRVYLAYGTSFNPSAEYLVSSGRGVDSATDGLAPEQNRTWELGTKWTWLDSRLELDAALFRVEKRNARERLSDGTSLLAGQQRVQGLELAASGQLSDEWALFANYTWQTSETLASRGYPERVGQALSNTPPRSFNLWTTYQLPAGITLGYGVRHVSQRNVTSQDSAKLDAYWVHDAMLGYRVNEHLDLQLNLANLFDKAYVEGVRQVSGSGSRSSALEFGEARSAVLSGTYRF